MATPWSSPVARPRSRGLAPRIRSNCRQRRSVARQAALPLWDRRRTRKRRLLRDARPPRRSRRSPSSQSPERGLGSRCAVPHEASQRRTALCETTRPASASASARASERASASGESNRPFSVLMTRFIPEYRIGIKNHFPTSYLLCSTLVDGQPRLAHCAFPRGVDR